jgi:transposase
MGHTEKRNYDRFTLAYKLQALKLANHPDFMSKDIAESPGIHSLILYLWQVENKQALPQNRPARAVSAS